jgi:hypothetical protein
VRHFLALVELAEVSRKLFEVRLVERVAVPLGRR